VKHDSSSSTSCNQSANTVNAVSDDSDSISSSTDVPPEYTKDEYKKPAVTAKMFAITGFAIKDFILFYLFYLSVYLYREKIPEALILKI